ncbi:RNA polymerase sigma factor [Flavobacterium sp. ABG]|uniref:RNA polymerase sigma factor n=1 Tax=Flavobacterium sp. ABG TaxID=1423322 RepID=UPI00064988F2|nr:sigma-70 family RNA polymerase sigma factor [Flavobacterium sp. ABG]KLT68156.1 ECF subfamily RNA polymerase sigma-24 factor [Flavobacterium sp. ABG]
MNTILITRLRDGDDSCFKEIYELYHFKVYCFVKKYAAQPADVEDITQNVFIHIWKYRTKIDPSIPLDSILFKSCKQEISKWYKKQNEIFSMEYEQLVKDLDETDEAEETVSLNLEKIEILLQQIPEKRRKIFTLHKFDEMSYKEIAAEMGMSQSAVANQISKTLQYLKKNSIKSHELYWFLLMFINHN